MRRWTNEVIVGISIIAAIVITMFGYVYLREIPVRQKGFEVTIIFNNVTGLEPGDAITVSGLKVGRIKNMKLQQGRVEVRIWLNGEVPFPRDSRAYVRSIGMIGEKYIELRPGQASEFLQHDDTIVGQYVTDLADSGANITDLLDQTTAMLNKLNTAIDSALSPQAQKAIEASLVNTQHITAKLNRNLETNLRHLSNTLAHLDTLSAELKTYWQANEAKVDSITTNVAQSTADLPALVARIDSAVTTTQRLLAAVDNQDGSVGKAIHDQELYDRATQTLTDVQAILADFKKNPGKFLQFSVIQF